MAFSSGSAVPDAFRNLLGINESPPGAPNDSPSWKDELKEAAYIPPSGKRFPFAYEEVSLNIPLRGTEWGFPNVKGSYIQKTGLASTRYPMRVYFWGPNCNTLGKAFVEVLCEQGNGKLEHPLYGTISNVTPFGEINRRDDLVREANQVCIEVVFFTTTGAVYPSSPNAPKSEINAALDAFAAQAAAMFEAGQGGLKQGIVKDTNLKAKITATIRKASKYLSNVAAVNTAVTRDFRDAQSAINFGIDVLVGQPLQLAIQVENMITLPARALAGITTRLEAYGNMAQDIIGSSKANAQIAEGATINRVLQKLAQDFQVDDLSAMSAVAGSITSAVNNTFKTKPEALSAAEAIIDQLADVVEWRDDNYAAIGAVVPAAVDTGESYQALQAAAALAAGYLIQISSTLIPERRLTLDRARSIIDVCAQVYGTVDNKIDFLIESNDFSGDEIIELPAGTVVKYYV
jgi:hypothetical protein